MPAVGGAEICTVRSAGPHNLSGNGTHPTKALVGVRKLHLLREGTGGKQ